MTDVLLFHHAVGLTEGVHAFANVLRFAGHDVTVPDLYDGRVFGSIEEGVAHAEGLGVDTIMAAGMQAAADLPPDIVYAGFSLGAMPAQRLVQQRSGARGATARWFGVGRTMAPPVRRRIGAPTWRRPTKEIRG